MQHPMVCFSGEYTGLSESLPVHPASHVLKAAAQPQMKV